MLCSEGILREPLLYLSLYFKAHRSDYYRLLQEVRERGAWEVWLEFFLAGVESTASQAVDAAKRIIALFEADRQRIEAEAERVATVLRVHEHLKRRLLASQKSVTADTTLSPATVNSALDALVRLGVAREITGRLRNRLYAYGGYLEILNEGAQPLQLQKHRCARIAPHPVSTPDRGASAPSSAHVAQEFRPRRHPGNP